jgi:hypothetical protein
MKILTPLLLIILLISCSEKQTNNEYPSYQYDVLYGDKKAGYFTSSQDEDGNYKFVFEYNDRGRGPHVEETIALDDNGLIKSLQIIGHNYLKDTVSETFSVAGNKASWESTSENGNAEVSNAFYVGVNSTYGSLELMLKKIMTSADQSIAVYPSGKVKISSVKNQTINDTLTLKMVEYTGFSFEPEYIWLDENNRFFASPSSWRTTIRQGYQTVIPQLLEIQTTLKNEYYKSLAEKLTIKPEGKVVIKNANVFDSENGTILSNKHVVINGNRIESIIDGNEPVPSVSKEIDGTGKTLLPGLFDMHGHLDRIDGIMNLAAGVTSVRDMANSFDLPDIRDEFNNNTTLGPRILIMCGFIDQAGPYSGPSGKIIKSLEEGLDAIDFYHERGYQQIKLYSSIDPSWVKPMAKKIHALGMRLSGHIPSYMIAEQAIKDGYDEIQHINMLALNFLGDTIDTRTPLRFSMVGKYTHSLDLESKEFKDFIALLKSKDIVVDPTVSIFEKMLTTKAGEPNPSFESILDRLPIQVKRGNFTGGLPVPEIEREQFKASYQKLMAMVKALYDAGIRIVPGTDSMVGFGLHKELENYVTAGIPAAEVLKIATIKSAAVIGNKELGVVKKGYLADLILVDGNPIEDISNIRRVEFTIKNGLIYDTKALYEAVGIASFK